MPKITDPELLDAGKVLKRLAISTLTGVIGVATVDLGIVGCAGCIYVSELLLEKIGYHFEAFVPKMDALILGILLLIVSVFAAALASRDMYLYLVRSERKREAEHSAAPAPVPRRRAPKAETVEKTVEQKTV